MASQQSNKLMLNLLVDPSVYLKIERLLRRDHWANQGLKKNHNVIDNVHAKDQLNEDLRIDQIIIE